MIDTKTYWEQATPMSFGPEKWSHQQKRTFRYELQDYMTEAFEFHKWRGKSVLEVGCGSGIDAVEFALNGALVTAIDITDNAIALTEALALEAGVKVTVFKCPSQHIPYKPDTFDCVYSYGVLHHIPDVDRSMTEIHRVLKPGGTFMGMVYHKDSLLYAYSIVHLHRDRLEYFHDDDHLVSRYSERIQGCPYTKAYTIDEAISFFGKYFQRVAIKVCYDVIDHPTQRKIKVKLPLGLNLGWHLVVKGVK